jgi:hypothetical protein
MSLRCRQIGVVRTLDNFTKGDVFHRALAGVPAVADSAGVPRHEVQNVTSTRVIGAVAVGAMKSQAVMEMAVSGFHFTRDGLNLDIFGNFRMLQEPLRVAGVHLFP